MTKKSILTQAETLFKKYQNKDIPGASYGVIGYNAGLKELQFLRYYSRRRNCCLSSSQASFDLFKIYLNIGEV